MHKNKNDFVENSNSVKQSNDQGTSRKMNMSYKQKAKQQCPLINEIEDPINNEKNNFQHYIRAKCHQQPISNRITWSRLLMPMKI